MNKTLRYIALAAVLVIVMFCGVAAGVVVDRQVLYMQGTLPSNSSGKTQASTGPDQQMIQQAWNIIQNNYVDRKAIEQPNAMTYGAISGMVDALGDTGHSRFQTPEDVKQEQKQNSREFTGVGLVVEMKDGAVTVVSPIDNTPAQKAGIKAGDIITKVDGKDISGLSLDKVVEKIVGPAGTQVTLTIYTPKTTSLRDVTLTRATIKVENVTWHVIPGTTIADIRISAYSQGVSDDLAQALQDIQKQGMTGIVLDLRNDPGGLLNEAVGVTSQFLKTGDVMLGKDAKGNITHFPVENKRPVTSLPLVVLINYGTGSAAEITAAALQDSGRATLVGETTFGTGTVLQPFNLPDGSSILLATEEWLTPKGNTIWHTGISPNKEVKLPSDVSLITPYDLRDLTSNQLQESKDAQLLTALSMVKQGSATGSVK